MEKLEPKNEELSIICDKKERMIRYLDEILGEMFEEDNECNTAINECEKKLKEVFNTIEISEKKVDPNSIFFTPQVTQRVKYSNSLSEEISNLTRKIENLKKRQDFLEKRKSNLYEISSYIKNQNINDVITENNVVNNEINELNSDQMHIKMLEIQETERNRIAGDIHDTIVQNLTSLVHKAELCTKLVDRDSIRTKLELQTMSATIRQSINDLRAVIYDLRPMSIYDLGLVATLKREIQTIEIKENFKINLEIVNDEYEIMPIINLTVYRIIQEACNNIRKHAHADNVYITIKYLEKMIEIVIEDDGVGIGNNIKENTIKNDRSGLGLSIMKERVYLLGGSIYIMNREGGGTKIVVKIPIL